MSFNMSELGLGSFDIPFTFKLRLVFIDYSLYTTNFTEPLSYQGSAFLKLPKFP